MTWRSAGQLKGRIARRALEAVLGDEFYDMRTLAPRRIGFAAMAMGAGLHLRVVDVVELGTGACEPQLAMWTKANMRVRVCAAISDGARHVVHARSQRHQVVPRKGMVSSDGSRG